MKIVVLDGFTENPGDLSWDGLARLGDLTVYDRTPPESIVPRIGDAEIVVTNKTVLTREVIAACPALRYIALLSTGTNAADGAAAREKGIPVSNVPAYGTMAVAQHAIALLLEVTNRVGQHSAGVHAGRWVNSPDFCWWDHPLTELAGKTMGIIGFGAIGQRTALIAQALGMKVLAHSRT